jgi:threonine aldolase
MMDFRSDNIAAMCPELLEALVVANSGTQSGYGADDYSAQLDSVFSAFFETDVRVFTLSTGTAANSLAIAALCPGWGSVLCHREAHIERDECGAPAFFSGGATLTLLDGPDAKITPAALEAALRNVHPGVHMVQPKLLSLTQATERGTLYTVDELARLGGMADDAGLFVHMDGARFANALVALECSPAHMSWRAGVDVLSFGATKNGGYACEAVVFFDPGSVRDFEVQRKRSGHLGCKSRYTAAQWLAYLGTDVWQRNAAHANAQAARIAKAGARFLIAPPQTNQIFMRLTEAQIAALRAQDIGFYDWGAVGGGEVRFVTSWQSRDADVTMLCALLEQLA